MTILYQPHILNVQDMPAMGSTLALALDKSDPCYTEHFPTFREAQREGREYCHEFMGEDTSKLVIVQVKTEVLEYYDVDGHPIRRQV